jgi:SAM-dependent methyltransferase
MSPAIPVQDPKVLDSRWPTVSEHYNAEFYDWQRSGSVASARVVVPIVLELVPVRSVCDFGCGVGTWLKVFREGGIIDVAGLDGAYVDPAMLEIPRECFIPTDLTKAVKLDRQFDLAVSLEVAEHLPSSRAETFVRDLTRAAPLVLFSAAIPGQGGENHLNEQWQSYWAERFARQGYIPIDAIRARIWDDRTVGVWYRQNILLYCAETALTAYPKLANGTTRRPILSIVHPEHYEQTQTNRSPTLRDTVRTLPKLVYSAVRRRLWSGSTS